LSYLAQTYLDADLLEEGLVAEDLFDRDSSRASIPYRDRGDADHAVLVLPGSLVPEDHEDPWDRDHAVAIPSAHEVRDYQLLSLPGRKVPLLQDPPGEAEFVREPEVEAEVAVEAVVAAVVVEAQVLFEEQVVVEQVFVVPAAVHGPPVSVLPHREFGLRQPRWLPERWMLPLSQRTLPPWPLHWQHWLLR
jgi:hypothetical protein